MRSRTQIPTPAPEPGPSGQDIIAAIGWHGPGNTQNNGFYESTDSGVHFAKVTRGTPVRAVSNPCR